MITNVDKREKTYCRGKEKPTLIIIEGVPR